MKLQLSAKEAVSIIKAHLNLTQHVEIIIEPAPEPLSDEDPRMVSIVRDNMPSKIPAIKEIRDQFGLSLKDAKDIVDRITAKICG
jgi:ribosomal protein L7/L12